MDLPGLRLTMTESAPCANTALHAFRAVTEDDLILLVLGFNFLVGRRV